MSPATARARSRLLLWTGALLVAAGLAIGGYVLWQLFGTNIVAKREHRELRAEVEQVWREPGAAGWRKAPDGEVVGLLRVPRFGSSYEMPILVGFADETLARGVGWYDDGAEPGEEGNVVLAAHRVTHGEPFADLPSLRAGDLVEVETRTAVRTYRLVDDGDAVEVSFETAWPLWPVPDPEGAADREPREQMITLVTCSELFHTDDRLIVRGVLTDVEPKRDAPRGR